VGLQHAVVAECSHAEAPEAGILQHSLDKRATHLAGGTRDKKESGRKRWLHAGLLKGG
jgi:hypothetical protein